MNIDEQIVTQTSVRSLKVNEDANGNYTMSKRWRIGFVCQFSEAIKMLPPNKSDRACVDEYFRFIFVFGFFLAFTRSRSHQSLRAPSLAMPCMCQTKAYYNVINGNNNINNQRH